jgi:hypothetical protein
MSRSKFTVVYEVQVKVEGKVVVKIKAKVWVKLISRPQESK